MGHGRDTPVQEVCCAETSITIELEQLVEKVSLVYYLSNMMYRSKSKQFMSVL